MNVYLLTLLLAAGIALVTALALETYSHRMRVPGVFRVDRGAGERPCWGGVAVFVAFAVTPFVASALSAKASEFFSPKSGEFLGFLARGCPHLRRRPRRRLEGARATSQSSSSR